MSPSSHFQQIVCVNKLPVYFQPEFLSHYSTSLFDDFPFFRQTEINVLPLLPDTKVSLRDHFVRLHHTFKSQHPYRVSILQALLLDCKGLYEDYRSSQKSTLEKSTLAIHYQQLLEQHYISIQSVQAYAELLNVTPNHLSHAVTNSLGRRAQDLIADRLLLEAKKLLRYTDLPIMDIADYLGFKEPTHFGRLFKRKLGLTPLEYRRRMAKEE